MSFKEFNTKFSNRRAITSYGIILFTVENKPRRNQILYQIVQRRDSISYSEFLQDRLPPDKIEMHIKDLMSKDEKKRCLEYYYKNDPESLWNDLWINHKSHVYKNNMKRCCESFMFNMKKFIHLFEDLDHGRCENTWGFPKGRKHFYETELECALREFEEEAKIPRTDIQVLDVPPVEEYYTGSDGKVYKTVCYIAYIPFIPKVKYQLTDCIRKTYISEEVSEMKWLPYCNCLKNLEDKHNRQLLTKVNKILLFDRRRSRKRRSTV